MDILRTIYTNLILFSLIFNSVNVFALTSLENTQLQNLIHQHLEIKNGIGSVQLINKLGTDLSNQTYEFLSNPKNKNILNTIDGQNLIKLQQLLSNYIAVKKNFDNCVNDNSNKRMMKDRVLASMQKSSITIFPCKSKAPEFKNLQEFSNTVLKLMKKQVEPDFNLELKKQIMINTAKSLVAYKYKFIPDFMSKGYLNQTELKNLDSELCFKLNKRCNEFGSKFYSDMNNMMISFSKEIAQSEKKFDLKSATDGINQSLNKLNNKLALIQPKMEKGVLFDSAKFDDPIVKKNFDEYVNAYLVEANAGAGSLLFTEIIKDKAGGLKQIENADLTKDKKLSVYKLMPHQLINESDVKAAITEGYGSINSQTKHLNSNAKGDIRDLFRINPMAVGQVLARNPEFAGIACEIINEIASDDKQTAIIDNAFLIGSAVAGGALILTGVGAMAGSYLLTGAITTAGLTAAGTAAGTVMAATATAGVVLDVTSVAYFGSKAYTELQDARRIESAILTQNGDNQSVGEKIEAITAFKEARLNALMSFASGAGNFINAEKLFKLTKALPVKELKSVTDSINKMTDSLRGTKVIKAIELIGEKGADSINRFMTLLAESSEGLRLKFLEKLKDSSLTPEKIKIIFEEALNTAKDCK
jgi:polyhydroxyalkanoate synthesis regulator phasin